MTIYGPFERVFVEWYDSPRAGIADVNGQPHRFLSQFDEDDDEYLGTFLFWPVNAEELALEQEQWQIYATHCRDLKQIGFGKYPAQCPSAIAP
jgi:hypothetical protein